MELYKKLEKEYAEFAKYRYGVAVNSGTAALHLALLALEIGPGDEVIVPDFTMASCAFAVSYTGATPIFVDCGNDLNIDPNLVLAKITPRTKAIMAVHIYGRLCDIESLKQFGLPVIEDGCEAQGATTGVGDIACFSFFKNKIIHAEEGGMLCTNDKSVYENVQDLKNLAFGEKHNYFHERIGFNYRMPESQANMALVSLGKYSENSEKRRNVEGWYEKRLKKGADRDAVWVYDVVTEHKGEAVEKLNQAGIPARHFFKPCSSFPMYNQPVGTKARYFSENGFYLPVNPDMTESEVNTICDKLEEVMHT